MNKKVQRNWAILLSIAAIIVTAISLAITFNVIKPPWDMLLAPREKVWDPVAAGYRIEEAAPCMDVLHVDVVNSFFLGNPVFHVAVQFWPVPNPYSVELTGTSWRILSAGEYTWEPGQDESVYDQWHYWTEEKLEYYSENAMFPPGRAAEVGPAVEYLKDWYQDKLLTDFFLAVYKEAYSCGEEWVAVEVSYLGINHTRATMVPGVDASGEPGYVMAIEPTLGVIELQWKKLADTPDGEGYWMEEAVASGEFTVDQYRELKEIETIQEAPGWHPFWGPIPYTYGFNHPWQARGVPR